MELVSKPLTGMTALLTSGPTFEPIDPVRYIGNRSSGKQGFAIAEALAAQGASVTVVSGPCALPDPQGCRVVRVETAREMLEACQAAGAVDIAVCVAAVADYHVSDVAGSKIRKEDSRAPIINLVENPDILKWIAQVSQPRPRIVVGFAGETEKVLERALNKRINKSCDFIIGNNVSPEAGTFGSENNQVWFIDDDGPQEWPKMSKREVSERLVTRIIAFLRAPVLA